MTHTLSNATLLLIDIQKAFNDPSWGPRNNPEAEENIEKLLTFWRKSNRPVVHIQHVSRQRSSSLFYIEKESCEFKDLPSRLNMNQLSKKV